MSHVDNKESQKFFDQLAPEYDAKRHRGFLSAAEAALDFYMRKFPSRRHEAILEIGVGTGEAFTTFAQRYKVAVAFDISHAMVTVAKRKATAAGQFCVASAEALPFKGRAFDAVLCMDVLEHVHSPAAAMREIGRVLARGGMAYVTTPNPLWAPIQWAAETLKLKVPEGPHRYVFLPALAHESVCGDTELVVHHVGFLVYAPLSRFTKPEAGWTLAQKPLFRCLGHNQLVIVGRQVP